MAHSKRHRIFKTAFSIGLALLCLLVNSPPTRCEERPKSLAEFGADLSAKTRKAYDASPFMAFSRDYFARIIRDPEAKPAENETAIDEGWKIYLDENPDPLVERMAAHLSDFLVQRMDLELETVHGIPIDPVGIVLSTNDWIEEGASDSDSPEDRFQVYVKPGQVFIYGK
ncbi:MAG: hypothetical protein KC931_23660, partial [Candidatus Omnitrophica bacterium]|nr:hypothetical protein [Candidatus Omnitrophota bacterium]